MAQDIGNGPFAGHGFRIMLGQEYPQDVAQAQTLQNYKATNGGKKRDEPTVGSLVSNGWGQLLRETLIRASGNGDVMSDVLGFPAYNLGTGNAGGNLWLVPVSTGFDAGKGYTPRYREVTVWVDTGSAAAERAVQEQADAAGQLAAAQARAATAQAQKDALIALAKAGQGLHSYELSVSDDGDGIQAAMSPEESSGGTAHPGISIIDDGQWETIYGSKTPGSFGLPRALLASSDGGKTIHAATREYQWVLAAAQQGKGGAGGLLRGLEDELGLAQFFDAASQYTPQQIQAAQAALQYLGIPF